MKAGILLAGGAAMGLPLTARAVDIDWDNSSGDGKWTTPTNWTTDTVPVADDDAVFINPAAGPATIDTDIPSPRDIRFGSEIPDPDGEGPGTVTPRPGTGTVNHTAGNVTLGSTGGGWLRMGIGGAGSGGTYNLSGGSLTGGEAHIGESTGSTATFNMDAGSMTFARLFAGRDGTGTVDVDGGDVTFNRVDVGAANVGRGTFDISSGNVRQTDNDNAEPTWNRIGGGGTATFNVSGGTVSFNSRTIFAAGGESVATATQTGGTVETRVGDINIADTGTATYTISGGTLRKGGAGGDGFVVGQWTGGEGTLNVQGTANVVSDARMILGHGDPAAAANTAVGIVNQSGGTVTVAEQLQLGQNASGNGTYNLSGGVLDMTGGPIEVGAGAGAFNMTGGEIRNASSIEGPGGTFTQAGGTLNSGPGDTPGVTTIEGNYTQTGAPNVRIDITSAGNDSLDVNGAATLTGTLDLVIAPGTTLNEGQMFTVLTSDGLTGTFSDATGEFTEDGYRFSTSYANNNVVLTVIPIPEPATAALAGLGAAGLLLRRRRSTR